MSLTEAAVRKRPKPPADSSNGNGSNALERTAPTASSATSKWWSDNSAKREGEKFFLAYSAVWIASVVILVGTRGFELFDEKLYLLHGAAIALPAFLWPMLFPGPAEAKLPFTRRFTTKANIWIWILSFNANYFWTHYFYQVLGARYTFPSHRFNDVPINLYLITHAYFAFYHTFSNILLRRLWRAVEGYPKPLSYGIIVLVICVLSYAIAFGETFTIQNFPYYEFADRRAMYIYGSMFYAIYFLVSFPMFLRFAPSTARFLET